MDEAKKSCSCVMKNSEFYRGALALETFSVSEVNIAPSDFTRFRENPKLSRNHEAGSFLEGPQKGLLFEHFLTKNEC